jgi:hypothetical protein
LLGLLDYAVDEIPHVQDFGSKTNARRNSVTTTMSVPDADHGGDSKKEQPEEERNEAAASLECFDESLSIRESLGLFGCTSILLGSIALLGTLGFLSFLYFGHGSDDEGKTATWIWREIAIRGWMDRTITLCTMVIQVM